MYHHANSPHAMVPTPATMKASRQEPSAAISPAMTMAPRAVPSDAPPVSRVAPRARSVGVIHMALSLPPAG
jgi:hypothetical protein